jgi:predicted RNase H-like nuclease
VDACRTGWVGVLLADERVEVYAAARIEDLLAAAEAGGPVEVVAIDIPIGLPDAGRRRADELARGELGQRWASVFMTPVRAALQADSHAAAVVINRRLVGEGISAQAYGLRSKLFEVDGWVHTAGQRVVEVHPELCFARMAGRPMPDGKRTWAGATHRRRLLADIARIVLPDDLGPAGRRAAVDDVLDAAAAAWTARRVAHGQAKSLPDPPEPLTDGHTAAIWT